MTGVDHLLHETITRELTTHRFHHHGSQFAIELLHGRTERLNIIVTKRHRRACEFTWDTQRLQPRQQMTI